MLKYTCFATDHLPLVNSSLGGESCRRALRILVFPKNYRLFKNPNCDIPHVAKKALPLFERKT